MVDSVLRIHVRQADRFDAAPLAALRCASLIEMGLLPAAQAEAFRRRALPEFWRGLCEERIAAWLLSVDDRIVGCACLVFWERLPYPETSLHAELAGVYVAPEFRRLGYARELIGEALTTARACGVRKTVLQPTEGTRELYRTFGFAESGQMRA